MGGGDASNNASDDIKLLRATKESVGDDKLGMHVMRGDRKEWDQLSAKHTQKELRQLGF